MHVSSAATQLTGDRMDVAVVSEIPGLEVLRVDAVPSIWTWYHETYTVAIAYRQGGSLRRVARPRTG